MSKLFLDKAELNDLVIDDSSVSLGMADSSCINISGRRIRGRIEFITKSYLSSCSIEGKSLVLDLIGSVDCRDSSLRIKRLEGSGQANKSVLRNTLVSCKIRNLNLQQNQDRSNLVDCDLSGTSFDNVQLPGIDVSKCCLPPEADQYVIHDWADKARVIEPELKKLISTGYKNKPFDRISPELVTATSLRDIIKDEKATRRERILSSSRGDRYAFELDPKWGYNRNSSRDFANLYRRLLGEDFKS